MKTPKTAKPLKPVQDISLEEAKQQRDLAALEALFFWQLGRRDGERWSRLGDRAAESANRWESIRKHKKK